MTVVIATYNWATVLPYSVGSVLDQTFTDFEVLVVGDGCTDESEVVVTAIDDPRVHWVALPRNTGHQSGPNNEGLRRARGEVVAYLGHDDLWLPHHLEVLVPVVVGGAPVAHADVLDVSAKYGITVHPAAGWTYTRGDWIPPTSFAVARSVLRGVGGWRAPSETGTLDPEADLVARVADVFGPPVHVRRLTSVKLPASTRRDVYRTRPSFEQDYWRSRIRGASDPEATLRATVGTAYAWAGARPRPGLRVRAWRRVQRRLRAWGLRRTEPGAPPTRAITRYRRNRRFKGL